MVRTLIGGVGGHHVVTFNFGSAPAVFDTCFSYKKGIWIAAAATIICTFTQLCYLHCLWKSCNLICPLPL